MTTKTIEAETPDIPVLPPLPPNPNLPVTDHAPCDARFNRAFDEIFGKR